MGRTLQFKDLRIELDLAPQVLAIHLPPEISFSGKAVEAEIAPTPSRESGFVSASMLAQKAKLFDDGLLAAVELAAQTGAGKFSGKAELLKSVLRALIASEPQASQPVSILLGAARLGNLGGEPPARLEPSVSETVERFLATPLRSKPIGFFTWTEELSRIFQQDRLLQQPFEGEGADAVTAALRVDPATRALYESYLRLVSRLTNPLVEDEEPSFFPPSRAHETDLAKKLYGNIPIPEGFDLMDELVRRIRDGSISLEPTADSGWYDYQTWALEPLVVPERMPEAKKLKLDPEYKTQLLELFKGVLALTRETHIKQLQIPTIGAAVFSKSIPVVEPQLSAEPTLSYYVRRARSYRFVEGVLEDSFGGEFLARARRLTPDGPVRSRLKDELQHVEALFHGASVVLARELGLSSEEGDDDARDSETFLAWARDGRDPDLSQDVRMMVPVFCDIGRRKTKVWAFLGWSSREALVSFARRPDIQVFDRKDRNVTSRTQVAFGYLPVELPYPVLAEVYVTEILDRTEFRRHCDRFRTREAILGNLR